MRNSPVRQGGQEDITTFVLYQAVIKNKIKKKIPSKCKEATGKNLVVVVHRYWAQYSRKNPTDMFTETFPK